MPRDIAAMLTGEAAFVDDAFLPGQAFGTLLRSPFAHARIRAIDVAAARRMPGVLSVWTGADIAALADPLPCVIPPAAYGRTRAPPVDRPILAVDRVRHVGDGMAFVVAETLDQAVSATEAIVVEYDPLPPQLAPHPFRIGHARLAARA